MKSVIYLDMDGVLADFEGWANNEFSDWKAEINKPGWGAFDNCQNLFLELPLMCGALELYDACVNITQDINQVQILTALPKSGIIPLAAQHKIEWARKNIHPNIRVNFGPHAQHKQYHQRHEDDLLIDDMEINISQWLGVGGYGILHTDWYSTQKQLYKYENKTRRL